MYTLLAYTRLIGGECAIVIFLEVGALNSEDDKIARLEEQIAEKKAALQRARARQKERDRKAKNKRLFQIGRLAEMAGIDDVDEAAILGGMIQLAERFKDETQFRILRETGSAKLREQGAAQKSKKRAANG